VADIQLIDPRESKPGFEVLSKSLDSGEIDDWREKWVADLLAMFQ
jgi:hypothetical protein